MVLFVSGRLTSGLAVLEGMAWGCYARHELLHKEHKEAQSYTEGLVVFVRGQLTSDINSTE